MRFWFRFVRPYQADLEAGSDARHHVNHHIVPRLADHTAGPFEDALRRWIRREFPSAAICGPWWGNSLHVQRRAGTRHTEEIDAVAINSALAGAPTAIPQLRIEISNSETRVIVPNAPADAIYKLQHSHAPYGGWRDLDAPSTRSGGDLVFADRTSPRPGQHFYRVVMP
jgi:hypothetical protein